jgi:hypothetical protein
MPHVHLISSFRYPVMPRLDLNEVAKWLMSAPQVARDRAPFFWTYLDKPTDGTMLLTWQPLQRLGTNFATDGYVWAPPEQVYKHDLGNGLVRSNGIIKQGNTMLNLSRCSKSTTKRPVTTLVNNLLFTPVDDAD